MKPTKEQTKWIREHGLHPECKIWVDDHYEPDGRWFDASGKPYKGECPFGIPCPPKALKDAEIERLLIELKRGDKNYLDLKNEFDDRIEAKDAECQERVGEIFGDIGLALILKELEGVTYLTMTPDQWQSIREKHIKRGEK